MDDRARLGQLLAATSSKFGFPSACFLWNKDTYHAQCILTLTNIQTLREDIRCLKFCRTMTNVNILFLKDVIKPLNIDFMGFTQVAKTSTETILNYIPEW